MNDLILNNNECYNNTCSFNNYIPSDSIDLHKI